MENNNQDFDNEDPFIYEPFNNSAPQDFVNSTKFTYSSVTPQYDSSKKSLPKALGSFLISIICYIVVSIIVMNVYDIQYISSYQIALALMPTVALFVVFYKISNGTNTTEAITLCLIDFILSYLLFYAVMANGIHKMYPTLTLKESWDSVDAFRHINKDTKNAFYEQLIYITGINCVCAIILAVENVKKTNKRWKV